MKDMFSTFKSAGWRYVGDVTCFSHIIPAPEGVKPPTDEYGTWRKMEFSGEIAFVPYSSNGYCNRAAFAPPKGEINEQS